MTHPFSFFYLNRVLKDFLLLENSKKTERVNEILPKKETTKKAEKTYARCALLAVLSVICIYFILEKHPSKKTQNPLHKDEF
jgi:hypothetical protein